MDLTRPLSFLARLFPVRLFPARLPVPAAPRRPDSAPGFDASETAAPAGLHADLGLPPVEDVPPDAQSLRHAMTMWIG
ncbi:MAG: hypothetical protein ACK4FJ_04235 [Ferrovibrio sp.]|uniref:hypothetical protein n=1 Tax=Ferrovibrio sp. TaxID=1917215 RepID=UPI00391D1336